MTVPHCMIFKPVSPKWIYRFFCDVINNMCDGDYYPIIYRCSGGCRDMSNITTTNGRASPSAMTPLRTIGKDFTRGNCQENKLLRTWSSAPNRSSYRKNGRTLIIRMVAKTCQLSEKKKPEKDENCLLLSIIIYSQRVKWMKKRSQI